MATAHSVYFHPEALEEAERAYDWYHERNPAAGVAFLNDLKHAVRRVIEAPERWPAYQGAARCYVFSRFPFSLIYRCMQDSIEIIAIAHHRRKPGYWTHR